MIHNNRTKTFQQLAKMVTAVIMLITFQTGIVHAQPCALSMSISSSPVQQLGLSDIDIDHFESRALLFTVQITNDSTELFAKLHVTLMITLADGTTFPNAVEFVTDQFPVPHGGRTITNLDIGKTKEIKTQSFYYDDAARNRIQNTALGTGSLPAGRYLFHVSLDQIVPSCDAGDDNVEFVLQNSSRVELRSPADGETTNEFPFFEFYQDANRATLTVAEQQPGQSREDAITRKPPMLEVELNGQHSFLYSGGRPLEQGKTYVWQVVSKMRVAGGTDNTITSPIWSFTVSSSGAGAPEDAILNQLEEIFGPRYADVFAQIRNGNFKVTGKYSDNSATVSQSELLNLLNELREVIDTAELTFE